MRMERTKRYAKLILGAIVVMVALGFASWLIATNVAKAECAKEAEAITKRRIGSKDFIEHRSGQFNPKIHEILKGAYEDCLMQDGML